ncbi:MAG: toxin-antitoxin system TumE family protein [Candidatus Binataceae bacterium]
MSVAGAVLIFRDRRTDEQGNLRELVIWKVKPNARQPDGVRYRLAVILAGHKEPAVLYDNHHPKGHHRHVNGFEEGYNFIDLRSLIADFMADVKRVAGADE